MGRSDNVRDHVLVQGIDRESEQAGEFGKGFSHRFDLLSDQVTIALGKRRVRSTGFVVDLLMYKYCSIGASIAAVCRGKRRGKIEKRKGFE